MKTYRTLRRNREARKEWDMRDPNMSVRSPIEFARIDSCGGRLSGRNNKETREKIKGKRRHAPDVLSKTFRESS